MYQSPSFFLRWIVSSAAVVRVVTQRFSPTIVGGGEALRDDPNNGCGGDYTMKRTETCTLFTLFFPFSYMMLRKERFSVNFDGHWNHYNLTVRVAEDPVWYGRGLGVYCHLYCKRLRAVQKRINYTRFIMNKKERRPLFSDIPISKESRD